MSMSDSTAEAEEKARRMAEGGADGDAGEEGDEDEGGDGAEDGEEGEGEEEEEDDEFTVRGRKRKRPEECPYLDTINRGMLDFDLDKQCSVTLNVLNVYCCLVCGKYFQGRSASSPAALHSLQVGHHVFLNLHTARIYCLPENYEIEDSSLEDIKYALFPSYTKAQVEAFDTTPLAATTLDGTRYVPGIIGLNNINATDGINVVLQLLLRVPPLRNFFMFKSNYDKHLSDPIVRLFGEFVRKMWSPRLFRKQVSPHELLNEIVTATKKRFTVTEQTNPVEFLQWLLNRLHMGLGGTRKSNSSIIYKCFRGHLVVSTYRKSTEAEDKLPHYDDPQLKGFGHPQKTPAPFLMLSMDVPPPPLFKSESEKNIIPQMPLFVLLTKFNGISVHHNPITGEKKQYEIRALPPYLIFHIKRFTKNQYFQEKNPTIVNFPIKALDLSEYLPEGMSPLLGQYDLLSNVYHDGVAEAGAYKVDVQDKASSQWYELQDLDVQETMPDFFALSATSLLVYERRDQVRRVAGVEAIDDKPMDTSR